MKFTQNQITKARMAKTPEELSVVVREAGINMSMEQIHKAYTVIHGNSEMADEELINVAGGGCGDGDGDGDGGSNELW